MSKTTKNYELTVLIRDNDNREKTLDRVNELVSAYSVKIVDYQEDGLKRLAYEIDGEQYAHYYFWTFETPQEFHAPEITQKLDTMEDVLRHLLIVVDRGR